MKKEFTITLLVSLMFLSIGFLLLHYGLIGYGISFFIFLPFIIGYILGKSSIKAVSLWGLILSLISFFILLFIGELEGMVCILMVIPLIIGMVALGVLAKYLVCKLRKKNSRENTIKSTTLPFCLFLILGVVENQLTKDNTSIIAVKSQIVLPYTAMEVYQSIKSVDTLDAEKPFLMKLDLPIPQKCILKNEKVGGIRTCYFKGGQIVERITELKKGKILKMDVIDYQLIGRKWLVFKEAIYTFEKLKNKNCKMTRITTYSSKLYPRFYWKPLEKIGIEQEHEYIFRNLKKDLKNKYRSYAVLKK